MKIKTFFSSSAAASMTYALQAAPPMAIFKLHTLAPMVLVLMGFTAVGRFPGLLVPFLVMAAIYMLAAKLVWFDLVYELAARRNPSLKRGMVAIPSVLIVAGFAICGFWLEAAPVDLEHASKALLYVAAGSSFLANGLVAHRFELMAEGRKPSTFGLLATTLLIQMFSIGVWILQPRLRSTFAAT